jgi:hypothetical protein
MAAGEPTPIVPLRLVLTATGGVVTAGRADLVPGPGERVVDLPDARADALLAALRALGPGEEVAYDEQAGTFAARARALSAAEQADASARALVIQAATSAVGVNITALTAGQVRALLAILLYQRGALDGNGVVQPLAQWAGR